MCPAASHGIHLVALLLPAGQPQVRGGVPRAGERHPAHGSGCPAIFIKDSEKLWYFVYVDNLGILGTRKQVVRSALQELVDKFRAT